MKSIAIACRWRSALLVVGLAAAASVSSAVPTLAEGSDAKSVLKSMSDYLAAQQTISAKFNSSIEVITPGLEKIQFDSSSTLQLKRPDKLRIERVGGYADVELVFDGKTLTIHDKDNKKYTQASAGGSVDELVDTLQNKLAIGAPGADLLLSDVNAALGADVLEAKYIGQGVINGTECEHLAFRNAETDWQLWVRTGSDPIPCKMVITSKTVAGAPQYTLEIGDWKANEAIEDAAFAFTPDSADAKVEPNDLSDLDELPAGAPAGGQ